MDESNEDFNSTKKIPYICEDCSEIWGKECPLKEYKEGFQSGDYDIKEGDLETCRIYSDMKRDDKSTEIIKGILKTPIPLDDKYIDKQWRLPSQKSKE